MSEANEQEPLLKNRPAANHGSVDEAPNRTATQSVSPAANSDAAEEGRARNSQGQEITAKMLASIVSCVR
jgi:hypothetical protein